MKVIIWSFKLRDLISSMASEGETRLITLSFRSNMCMRHCCGLQDKGPCNTYQFKVLKSFETLDFWNFDQSFKISKFQIV